MAVGLHPVKRLPFWPGISAAALVVALTFGTVLVVALRADGAGALTRYDWLAVRFTVVQALVSAALSCALAVPVARALARRDFIGRGALITLLGAPFILPVIVAVLGLIAVFGKSGLLSQALAFAGFGPVSIYGFHGVILAHVFFNLPLAVRLILHGWLAIPAERFRLAAGLGFTPRDIFAHLERPMLREVLPGAFVVIFVICTTSFAVALALGGGPKATTVELAIYQAFRFDFDLAKAALLSGVQVAICVIAALVALRVQVPQIGGGGLDRTVQRFGKTSTLTGALDTFWIAFAALFLLTPLAVLIARGAPELFSLPASVWQAAGRSVMVALASTAVTMAIGLSVALACLRAGWIEALGLVVIAASPLVMGTGLFIVIFPFAKPSDFALPVTALVNATLSLPFVLRAILPELRGIEARFGPLADQLGLTGWARVRMVLLPRLKRPLGFAAGLSAALSMGDLGVITLFADPKAATLPLQLYQLMGAYRMDQAMGAALVLLALSLGLFYGFDRGGRADADA
ncbi:Sulfate transport system permease protein CysW [Aquimixticola soesokkakensis]|uniref:Sulfate transport system permease protein CysW n=1 Tax=Aquimixticola soesokkakensis TaxID=1519096 RepID=A0A1Y5R7V5_9RHOB|nr:thiamine/thiamine pyrophosphate ABC transporter permease ThiP [Aquimixticola soesokkakensis]SLN10003.1 Sulfate transport system permease protein CysW [Aquimixticola soesokkakensis]